MMEIGFYGKLPSHGDFLRRRTSDAFVSAWDSWLQDAFSASRASLGDRWLDVYLTAPVWRFAGAAQACGPQTIAGVMVPSVDRVGRYFPLTVIGELPVHVNPLELAVAAREFFDRAERVVLDALEDEDIDFHRFDREIDALGPLLDPFCAVPAVHLEPGEPDRFADRPQGLHFPIASSSRLTSPLLQLASHHLSREFAPLMFWWTDGSGAVQPEALIVAGLPHPESFAAMLDGSRLATHWWSVPARVAESDGGDTLVSAAPSVQYRSVARSHTGKVRTINQDSFIERTDVGIWVVADGLGGHADGEVASRMVCDSFAELVPDSTFEELIAAATERVVQVNDALVRAAERSLLGVRSGSTVVALLTRGNRVAILWAGDSRVYRWRNGRLDQLTRDHSAAEEHGAPEEGQSGGPESNVITRAVGGELGLVLDVFRDVAQPGDRFLLCSDGLTRVVPTQVIKTVLSEEAETAAESLLAATLDAGAPDNVTVLIVDATE